MNQRMATAILEGKTALGIELGSTRIKAVLIDTETHQPLAQGAYDWENQFQNGYWTYALSDAVAGVQSCYRGLCESVRTQCGQEITTLGALGFSGMMHGYIPFNKAGEQLCDFRTWRNTTTEEAAAELRELFSFNIPQRWSVAHLYQAVKNGESHVGEIDFLTTLAGYIHFLMSGERVSGVGEASGMFPIDSGTCDYNETMLKKLDALLGAAGIPYILRDILPRVLPAGAPAGVLTKAGAALLDPSGKLQAGIPLCPPEGDAGTGMVATNSIAERTGNVSAGTSVFAMVVLERPLSKMYPEIDMVTTPAGAAVAMVHCNTCTSDLDAWVRLFCQLDEARGIKVDRGALYELFYQQALRGEPDCGGLIAYNYYSGEPITGTDAGCPLFVRTPQSSLTLENFCRTHLFATIATLKLGMDILLENEGVTLTRLLGHGGLFKTREVGQKLLAAALNVPVAVMETAGEGGPWGMAILAAYAIRKEERETLSDYLQKRVFATADGCSIDPDEGDREGFLRYIESYKAALPIEKAAADCLIHS